MGAVLPFRRQVQEASEQTGTGEAFCLACRHEWQAVVPTGVTEFECPKCGTMKARFRYEHVPPAPAWMCNCGNQLFYMTEQGHLCPNCGIYQRYPT